MMIERLPLRFDPFRLAAQRARLQGAVAMGAMERLRAASMTPLGADAFVVAEFSTHPSRVVVMTGVLKARVQTVCQRCLGRLVIQVERPIELAMVRSDAEALRIQDALESYLVSDDSVFTQDLVEDELLLALPAIPVHEDPAQCDTAMLEWLAGGAGDDPSQIRENPFAVLKKMRPH
jgi:uncharacterized protein